MCSKIALVAKAMRWFILLRRCAWYLGNLVAKQCEGMMCGEMPLEGAFDGGNARVSCSESSTSTMKVTSGVTWKNRAAVALPANINSLSECGYCNFSIWPLKSRFK